MKIIAIKLFLICIFLSLAGPHLLDHCIRSRFQADSLVNFSYDGLDFDIWNLSYTLKNMRISQRSEEVRILTSERVGIIFQCNAKTKWKVTCDVKLASPQLNIIGYRSDSGINSIQSSFVQLIERITLASIDGIQVDHGSILLESLTGDKLFRVSDIHLSVRNVFDAQGQSNFHQIFVHGTSMIGGSRFNLQARFVPNSEGQNFDLKAELLNADFNSLAEYLHLPQSVGSDQQTVSLFAEATSEGQRILGFTNPRLQFIQQASSWSRSRISSRTIPFEVDAFQSSSFIQCLEIALREAFKQGLLIFIKENGVAPRHDILHRQPRVLRHQHLRRFEGT